MIWVAGIGVLKLTSFSVFTNDSIILSPDQAVVFTSFYDTTTFITSYVPYHYSGTFPWPPKMSPLPLIFLLAFSLSSRISDIFPWNPPLTPLPLKDLSWSLSDCLHFNAVGFLDFTFVISKI